ncbi:MAG: helix-turn-helix domain-containing protein, partial [Bacteroidales bacterium]|nr:helix-turn-helix domain-containing protein [Bacteroidales bacterium]
MDYELKKITIKEAAEQLNVSVVSIHNWIKEGSLQKTDNILTQKNIDDFKDKSLKNRKLSSRANKQYKDMHNHDSLSKDIR